MTDCVTSWSNRTMTGGHDVAEAAAEAVFLTAEGRADPYPWYHKLRDTAPVHRSESARAWLLTRYADCAAVLRDPRFGKSFEIGMDARKPEWREHAVYLRMSGSMLNLDGPAHTRLRRLVAKAFTPRTVEKLRPRIQAMVDEMLAPIAEAGGGDLIADLAFPLPVRVIGELLGVPEEDRPQFRGWVRDIVGSFEVRVPSADLARADAATAVVDEYFHRLIADKRANPGDDLLSELLLRDAGEDGDRLDADELVTLALLLFAAGFETTTNLVGNGMVGLLRHPDQLELLRRDPSLTSNLPDELLRYDGTVQVVSRFTNEDVEIGDESISAGQPVFAMLGAANRDPARYTDPDRLDVTRDDIRPLTFGGGVHFCLGAALAKAEIEIVFASLLRRFNAIELAESGPRYRDRLVLRGLEGLELGLSATAPTGAARSRSASPLPVRAGGDDDLAWREAYRRRLEAESGAAGAADDTARVGAIASLFARTPFLGAASRTDLEELAATAYPIDFEAGDVLCREGDEALEAYVIAEGVADVRGGGELIAVLHADDVIGERGAVEGQPRNATVTARSHMLTYSVSRERLLDLLARSPEAANGFREAMAARYSASLRTSEKEGTSK
jgi:cytochrome P450